MTFAQIKESTKDTLTPQDVAQVLGAHPQWIRDTAKMNPERIGFRFVFIGNRMKIPRLAFIAFMEGR